MAITLFSAEWCSNCKVVYKILEGMDLEYSIIDADTEQGQELCVEYEIRSLPTMIDDVDENIYVGLQQIKSFLESVDE